MQFGVCTSLAEAQIVLDADFDYVELGASEFDGLCETWDPSPYARLPIGATNLFFDSRIKLFGQERTPYREYAERTISRAASLGIKLMVIGSGATRAAPEGTDADAAFVDIVAEISDFAKRYGITMAPESLNRTETNVGNDLRSLAIALRDKSVGYTADSYHILFEWDADGRKQNLETLCNEQIPFTPSHVHIADLPRLGVNENDPMLQAFAGRIKRLGYDRAVSLECTRRSGFDFGSALNTLKSLFAP
jgi:sugar phosphate isomerase/epimerase